MNSILIRTNNRPTVPLIESKRSILSISKDIISSVPLTDSYVNGAVNYAVLSANNSLADIDIAVIRLHIYCIVGNLDALKIFINNFIATHGYIATKLLLNTNIKVGKGISNCSPFYITPFFAAFLWNTDPNIIRLLYSYGAKPNSPDINNLFIEEKFFSIPYFDHINSTNSSNYWRNLAEFTAVIQEIRALSGEHIFDPAWIPPTLSV